MNRTTTLLLIGATAVVGYFAWKRYQQNQRAAAHPITVQSDAQLLRPMPVNPALVTDAHIVV